MQSVLQFLQQNMHLIVVVFLVGSSAVGGLIRFLKEQAAKSEQRRRAERARQEMMRTGQIEATAGATGTSLAPQPLESGRSDSDARLDARRREQLEELRARARRREMEPSGAQGRDQARAGTQTAAGAGGSTANTPSTSAPPTNPLEVLLGLPPGSLTPTTATPSGGVPQGRASAGRGGPMGGNGMGGRGVGGSGSKPKKKSKGTSAARDEAEARERRQRQLAASAAASQALGSVVGGVVSSAWAQGGGELGGGTLPQGASGGGTSGAVAKPRSPRGKLLTRERGELRRAFLLTQVFGPPHALRD